MPRTRFFSFVFILDQVRVAYALVPRSVFYTVNVVNLKELYWLFRRWILRELIRQ